MIFLAWKDFKEGVKLLYNSAENLYFMLFNKNMNILEIQKSKIIK